MKVEINSRSYHVAPSREAKYQEICALNERIERVKMFRYWGRLQRQVASSYERLTEVREGDYDGQ